MGPGGVVVFGGGTGRGRPMDDLERWGGLRRDGPATGTAGGLASLEERIIFLLVGGVVVITTSATG